MKTLELYKNRKKTQVRIGKKLFFLPNEYTVDEVERILEVKAKLESLSLEEVDDNYSKIGEFFELAFYQIEIMVQHFQPEVTAEELKKKMTTKEATELIKFFNEHKLSLSDQADEEPKKKDKASVELRGIRRMIAYMVVNGFSLLELRKLYIDEFHEYYTEMFYILENQGKVKKGTYKQMRAYKGSDSNQIVDSLRKQMTNLINKG